MLKEGEEFGVNHCGKYKRKRGRGIKNGSRCFTFRTVFSFGDQFFFDPLIIGGQFFDICLLNSINLYTTICKTNCQHLSVW